MRSGGMDAKAGQRRRAVLLTEKARLILAPNAVDPDLAAAQCRQRAGLEQGGDFRAGATIVLTKVLTRRHGQGPRSRQLIEQAWD